MIILSWLLRFRWLRPWIWRLADTLRQWADVLSPPLRSVGADTAVAAGAAEVAEVWSDEIWLEVPEKVFWGPYIQEGEDVDAIIERKVELEKKQGDTINFTLARQLTGDGVIEDNRMEDNEDVAAWYTDDVTLRQFRNAIRLQGRLSEKRTAFSQRKVAKRLLRDWLASFIDNRIFSTLGASPTRAVYGGDATSPATIESGDYLTLALLTRTKTVARKATPQIFPVMISGGEYFLQVVTPDSLHDLQIYDPAWAQAQREAQERGPTNPIFTGAEGIYDKVVIRSCTRVPLATDWGSGANLNGSENLFCGKQAGVLAFGRKPEWVEQSFDYANKIGYAIGTILEFTKATFNAQDNGSINVRTFRSNIS